MSDTDWIHYAERRPEAAGIYEWRVPSVAVPGLTVTLFAHMRVRGAGYERVLSPDFDWWDGYRVIVPPGLQWREAPGATKAMCAKPIPEGVDVSPCLYCGKRPAWRASQSAGRGVVIAPNPQDLNSWRLVCCAWMATPDFRDPRELVARREGVATRLRSEGAEEMRAALATERAAREAAERECATSLADVAELRRVLADLSDDVIMSGSGGEIRQRARVLLASDHPGAGLLAVVKAAERMIATWDRQGDGVQISVSAKMAIDRLRAALTPAAPSTGKGEPTPTPPEKSNG